MEFDRIPSNDIGLQFSSVDAPPPLPIARPQPLHPDQVPPPRGWKDPESHPHPLDLLSNMDPALLLQLGKLSRHLKQQEKQHHKKLPTPPPRQDVVNHGHHQYSLDGSDFGSLQGSTNIVTGMYNGGYVTYGQQGTPTMITSVVGGANGINSINNGYGFKRNQNNTSIKRLDPMLNGLGANNGGYGGGATTKATDAMLTSKNGYMSSAGSSDNGANGNGHVTASTHRLTATSPTATPSGKQVPIGAHYYRRHARAVSVIDAIFATGLMVFHGLTLMVQVIPNMSSGGEVAADGKPNANAQLKHVHEGLLPRIPMTPGQLTITGYMEVIAWIGILSINFTQLLVAVGLFNACDKRGEVLKTFESTRVYIKTSAFLVIILAIKLCILYFMHHMEIIAPATTVFTLMETIFHIVALLVVFKFFLEIKGNYPMITQIYLTPSDDGPKTDPVADAVWF